jgi:limonene-1,2-epoxide hydrolase
MNKMLIGASAASLFLLASQALADARATVDAFAAAMAAKDKAAIEGAFTPDAGYAYAVEGDLSRGDKFDAWLQSDIVGPGSVFNIESASVNGETVDAMVVWGRGSPSTQARYIFTVVDGKIDSWRMTGR